MGLFKRDNVSFTAPAGWSDVGVTRLQAPPTPGGPPAPTISVERMPLRPGETLLTYYHRAIVLLGRQVGGVEATDRSDGFVAGRQAIILRIEFHTPVGPMDQTLVFVMASTEPEPVVMIFSVTAVKGAADEPRRTLFAVLDTVRFDEPGTNAPSGSRAPPAPSAHEGRDIDAMPPLVPIPGDRRR
jgi:hypothetical protein